MAGAPAPEPTDPLRTPVRWRTVVRRILTVLLPVVTLAVVLATINLNEITAALKTSDWRWAAVCFALGLVTYVGAGLAFVAFAPVRVSLWVGTLVHSAGAFVSMVAPAGVGSAALNLRLLVKRGVSGPLAVATAALTQVMQFVVTVVLLLIIWAVSGTNELALVTPGRWTLVVVGAVVVLAASSMLVPRLRRWVVHKTGETLRQTWPRLSQVLGHPGRMALAALGSAVVTLGYVLAFGACLEAFGVHLDLVATALVYLVGNAAGSLVPSPGGIGTIEVTLIAGLTAAGVNPGIAASAVILFRALTFWLPIPLGWLAFLRLQRRRDL